jgi:hypothetical protein
MEEFMNAVKQIYGEKVLIQVSQLYYIYLLDRLHLITSIINMVICYSLRTSPIIMHSICLPNIGRAILFSMMTSR